MVVERFGRERIRGYVNLATYLQPSGIEVMTADGNVGQVPYSQVKVVSFVRELEGAGVLSERREFLARPKTAGLWVELRFRDGDRLEGVLPNNLLLLEPLGYSFSPPESAGNAQRAFVPRAALDEISVLGVVGGKRRKFDRPETSQIRLFAEE